MKKILLIAVLLILVFSVFIQNTSFVKETLFEKEKSNYDSYFKEDFDSYSANSEILDVAREDLGRWQDKGVVTAWTDVKNWKDVSRIDLELVDSNGKKVILKGVENSKVSREFNQIKSNDVFIDYSFNCNQSLKKWEDFMIVDGRNFLFWEYNESLSIDMSQVESWKAFDNGNEVEIYDVVLHDGVCIDNNALNGEWSSPNGLPQYGVWWIEEGRLVMRNVEQEQYPSNGDHARVLSKQGTPDDFIFRTRFKVDEVGSRGLRSVPNWAKIFLGLSKEDPLHNTYIRIGWDFDNEYDPGHDQSLVYYTYEYEYLGLQRVYPIERYFVQGYEPHQSNINAKTKLKFKEGHTYEIDIKVQGKKAYVEVYDVGRFYWRKIGEVNYIFERDRPNKNYPFSIETTGDVELEIDLIEVRNRS